MSARPAPACSPTYLRLGPARSTTSCRCATREGALELHELKPMRKYYLAAFLVGAYQETLGDLHNLLGTRMSCTSGCR